MISSVKLVQVYKYGGTDLQLHALLIATLIEMNGQVHASGLFTRRTVWLEGWVDYRTYLVTVIHSRITAPDRHRNQFPHLPNSY
jgi:hypothetical protein